MSNFLRFKVGVNLGSLAVDPVSADSGDIYYNSVDNKYKVYNGTSWVELSDDSDLILKANTNLNNLIATSINQHLNPDTNLTRNLGQPSGAWNIVYQSESRAALSRFYTDTTFSAQRGSIGITSGTLTLTSLNAPLAVNSAGGNLSVGAGAGEITSRTLTLSTNAAGVLGSTNSGALNLTTGNVVDGTSGNITLTTGAESGTGARGNIVLDGQQISATSKNIINVADPVNAQDAATKNYVDTEIASLPTPLVYVGTWDASTNTPTLADGVGTQGNLYQVTVAGTVDFGAGPITFAVGDKVVYNGTVWEKWDNTDEVLSVNGQTGIVDLDTDDINEGAANFYYTEGRFNASLTTKSTDDLVEGGNLYFTDSRAQTAAVVNTLGGSEINQAPSVDAVNTALADYLLLSGITPMSGSLDMGTNNIINVVDPVNPQDAATKAYVDGLTNPDVLLKDGSVPLNQNTTLNGTSSSLTTIELIGMASDDVIVGDPDMVAALQVHGIDTTVIGEIDLNLIANTGSISLTSATDINLTSDGNIQLLGAGTTVSLDDTKRIINMVDPVDSQDAATKNYVDNNAGINYIENGNAEVDTAGWTTYADAAGVRPVDGTGGSPTITWTRTTSSPLRGVGSFLFTKDAANRQGEGASCNFTIDTADQAKVLTIQSDYRVVSGTFVAGTNLNPSDLTVWIYDVTNATLIEPSSFAFQSNSSITSDVFSATFQTTSDSTSYRLIIHVGTTSASAYVLEFDAITVSPSQYVFGTPVTDWQSYTPTGSWIANTTYSGKYRRVGDSAEISFKIDLSGAPTNATLTMNLPSGLVIDTTKTGSTSTRTHLGDCFLFDTDTGSNRRYGVIERNDTLSISIMSSASSLVAQTTPFTWATGDAIYGNFLIPVVGWSSSVQMSDSADTRIVNGQATKTGTQSLASTVATLITFDSIIEDSHGAFTSGHYVVPVAGTYNISGNLRYTDAGLATGYRRAAYTINDATSASMVIMSSLPPVNGAVTIVSFNKQITVNAGDIIRIFGQSQNSAGNTTVNAESYFDVERVSGPSAIAANETVAARYTSTGGASFANSGNIVVDFATKDFDTHSSVTTGASWNFKAPINGIYNIKSQGAFSSAAWSLNNNVKLEIYKNGSLITTGLVTTAQAAATFGTSSIVNDTIRMNAGDTVDIRVTQNRTGGAITSGNMYVSIEKIGN